MTVPTHVVIPTRDRLDLCAELTTELILQYEFDKMWVCDNTDAQDAGDHLMLDRRLEIIPAPTMKIYEMWNEGWLRSIRSTKNVGDPVNVAILNDDIRVPDSFLGSLAHALRAPENDDVWCVYPDYTLPLAVGNEVTCVTRTGNTTFRKGGMSGWAFMIKGEKHDTANLPWIDERFQWWCGDDDLAEQIVQCGGEIARVDGLPCEHESEASARLHPELHQVKGEDINRFRGKYGRF